MKRTRLFQITVLLLVVVAAVQVGYWLYDQHVRGVERTAALERPMTSNAPRPARCWCAQVPADKMQALFPDLYVSAGHVDLAPERRAALIDEQAQRLHASICGRAASSCWRCSPASG